MGFLDNQTSESYYTGDTGGYRYINLVDMVSNFMVAYVGDGKEIPDARRSDVLFHAKRGVQEFSYDISRVEKIQEVQIGSTLSMPMPQDYVDLTKVCWIDNGGIEHIIYPSRITSKPSEAPLQDGDSDYIYDGNGDIITGDSVTNQRFNDLNYSNVTGAYDSDDSYLFNDYDVARTIGYGGRYGLNPEIAQQNGVYIIDEANGRIAFSSDMNGRIVNLHYVSDGMGTDAEMKVHKFAEEAIYMHIASAIIEARANVPEYIKKRWRKRRFVAMRNAKIRLSSINLEEMTQVMRGKSKALK